jgi:hypothetical protein
VPLQQALLSENNTDAQKDKLQVSVWQLADSFHEQPLIDTDDLGRIGHGFFGQARQPL